jgi:hypothetical protein
VTLFLATLPPGAFLRAVMEALPYTSSFKEAAQLASSRLLVQYYEKRQAEIRHVEVMFFSPAPSVVLKDEETETMPAVIRERHLSWRKP